MRVALKFSYDGKYFSGYARQPGQRTIEGALLEMLKDNAVFDEVKDACFRTASRTDAGVSALGNVCAFDTTVSAEMILQRLSKDVSDVFVYGAQEVAPDFYPRHAKQRQYRYYLRNDGLDVDAVVSAALLFTGEHDFSNFARVEPLKNPVRTIDTIVFFNKEGFLVIDFFAQTFLWNQIRRIVSALERMGSWKLNQKDIQQALENPTKKVDFQVASPEPLILKDVMYDFSFTVVNDCTRKLSAFEDRIVSSL
jgi:tRNA pseudouridine38-40 synthase